MTNQLYVHASGTTGHGANKENGEEISSVWRVVEAMQVNDYSADGCPRRVRQRSAGKKERLPANAASETLANMAGKMSIARGEREISLGVAASRKSGLDKPERAE